MEIVMESPSIKRAKSPPPQLLIKEVFDQASKPSETYEYRMNSLQLRLRTPVEKEPNSLSLEHNLEHLALAQEE